MKKRAFVKYDEAGDIIPGSLVFTNGRTIPNKLYYEVTKPICCGVVPNPDQACVNTPGWSTTNLNVTTYRNGDVIPEVTNPTAWGNLTTGAWCYYDNDSANGAIYGKLYNWYAVNDPRGLAPVGYHIPSDTEWTTLTDCLGGLNVAGGKMKSVTGWTAPNNGATNSSGFTALPGAFRGDDGTFATIDTNGYWWSSTEDDTTNAWFRLLYYDYAIVSRISNYKALGLSVRVIQD